LLRHAIESWLAGRGYLNLAEGVSVIDPSATFNIGQVGKSLGIKVLGELARISII
jgi:hypothetical protein